MKYLLHNIFIDDSLDKVLLKDAQKQIRADTLIQKRAEITNFLTNKKTLKSKIHTSRQPYYKEIKATFGYGNDQSIFADIQESEKQDATHYLITDNEGLALFLADKQIEKDLKNSFDLTERFKEEINGLSKKIKDHFLPKIYTIGILQETLIELLLSGITLKKATYDRFIKHRQTLKKKSKADKIEQEIAESKLNSWLTDPTRLMDLFYVDSDTKENRPDKMERAFLEYEEIDFLENFLRNPLLAITPDTPMNDQTELRDTIFQILDDLFDTPDIETVYKNLLFRINYKRIQNLFEDCIIDSTLFSNPECFIAEIRKILFLSLHIQIRNVVSLNVPNWSDNLASYLIINPD